jgi:hypothetical protein
MSDQHIEAGTMVPRTTTLRDMGVLPKTSGTYQVTAIWHVPIGNLQPNPERIVVRSLPATIQVVDGP